MLLLGSGKRPYSSSYTVATKVTHSGLKLYAGDAFISYKKPLSHEQGSERSERARERVSAAEGASEATSLEKASK